MGIHGGSAFRAIAGYGRHGVRMKSTSSSSRRAMTVEVEFVLKQREWKR